MRPATFRQLSSGKVDHRSTAPLLGRSNLGSKLLHPSITARSPEDQAFNFSTSTGRPGRRGCTAAASASGMSKEKVDVDQVKQDWTTRIFSFGVFVDPPGQVWPDFTHQTDELVMLTKGEYELTFNGKTIRPSIGEEVLIPAKALHTVENVGRITNEWLYGYRRK